MVMRKFNEILENDKFDIVRDKCKSLFYEIYHDKLYIIKTELITLNLSTNYNKLYVKLRNPFDEINYKHYRELFDFLTKLKLEFDFNDSCNLDIYINNIDKFILELEEINNAKKYNL